MTAHWRRIVRAMILTAAVLALVAGCAPRQSGPSREEQVAALMARIESVPTVTGSLVNFYVAGVGERGIGIKIYTDDVEPSTLATTIDGVLGLAWKTSSSFPSDIAISVVDGPKPADPQMASIDGVDLTAAASTLGFGTAGVSLDGLLVDSSALAARYGAWVAPPMDKTRGLRQVRTHIVPDVFTTSNDHNVPRNYKELATAETETALTVRSMVHCPSTRVPT